MKKIFTWPLILIAVISFILVRSASYMFLMPFSLIGTLLAIVFFTLIMAVAARFRKRLLVVLPFFLLFLAFLYPTGFYTWCIKLFGEYSNWMWHYVPHPDFERLTVFLITFAITVPVFILIRCHSPTPILLFGGGAFFVMLENSGRSYPSALFWLFLFCVLLQMTLFAEPKTPAGAEKGKKTGAGLRALTVLPFCLLIVWAAGAFSGSGADPLRHLRDLVHWRVSGWGGNVSAFAPEAVPGHATDVTDIGSELGGPFRPSGALMLTVKLGQGINGLGEIDYPIIIDWVELSEADGVEENITITGSYNIFPNNEIPYLRGDIGLYYDGRRWSGDDSEGEISTDISLTGLTLPDLLSLPSYRIQYVMYRGKRLYMPYNLRAASVDLGYRRYTGDVFELNNPPPDNFRYDTFTAGDGSGNTEALPSELRDDYLHLPPALPQRVRGLADRLTVYEEDYYNALAIERHLVDHFTYNSEMPVTPEGEDFVDYFLNEQKEGYCVYFATAMTVLCRAAGLPARYVEGFAPSSSRGDGGVYLYTDELAHAWCEVYLGAERGWVQFEPTPGYNHEEDVWFPEPILGEEPYIPPSPIPSVNTVPSPIPSPIAEPDAPPSRNLYVLFLILPLLLLPVICWFLLRLRRRFFVKMVCAFPYTAKQAKRVYKHILWLESHAGITPAPHETLWDTADRVDDAWPTKLHVPRLAADVYGKICYGISPLTREESEVLCQYTDLLERRESIHLGYIRLYIYKKILHLL